MTALHDALSDTSHLLSVTEWPRITTPVSATYQAAATWEEYKQGDYQTATITKQVALVVRPRAGHYEVEIRVNQLALQKNDPEPLEELAVRLAALYEWIVVDVGPAGQPQALLNHEAMQQRWEALKTDLRQTSGEDDQITNYLITNIDQQLQDPVNLLNSLQFDYLYSTLFHLLNKSASDSERSFPQFFENYGLWFSERLTWFPTEALNLATVIMRGTLDEQQTDVSAIGQWIATALDAVLSQPPNVPAASTSAPHFGYQATYVVEQTTGMPTRIELTVYARLGELYNKEYTLLFTRL